MIINSVVLRGSVYIKADELINSYYKEVGNLNDGEAKEYLKEHIELLEEYVENVKITDKNR